MNACILCSIFALSDYCDLITLFAVFQVDKHTDRQNHNDKDIPSIFLSKQFRKPSCLSSLVNDTNRVGTFWIFPENDAVCNNLHGNIVQHQGKQSFICIPVCFEHCRNHSPDHTTKRTCNKHHDQKHYRRHFIPRINHHCCGTCSTNQDLTFCTDIPEFHFECRCQTDCDTQKHHRITNRLPDTALGTHCSVPDCLIYIHRIHFDKCYDYCSTHNQCKNQCYKANQKSFLPSGFISSFAYL